jgi:hypothetical protein
MSVFVSETNKQSCLNVYLDIKFISIQYEIKKPFQSNNIFTVTSTNFIGLYALVF